MRGLAMLALLALLALGGPAPAAADHIHFTNDPSEDQEKYRLPEGFLLGVGTSSYQSEGAWNVSGKGMNVLDYAYNVQTQTPLTMNGNIAADAYHHIEDDIAMIEKMKLNVYRISMSWARLLPTGEKSRINPDGLRYYNEIIDKLIKINVTPMITLYHFDHPQAVHERTNSWLSLAMSDAFVDYADVAFREFGDRVKHWVTLNEPNLYCGLVYGGGLPPGNRSPPEGSYYTCVYTQMITHAKTYDLYQKNYKSQGGIVGMTCNSDISRPNSTAYEDVQAAIRASAFGLGLCADPIIHGNWPAIVIKTMADNSLKKKTTSTLPVFSEEEQAMLKNSTDFLGINVYFGHTVADGSKLNCSGQSGGGPMPGPPSGGDGEGPGGDGEGPGGNGGGPGGNAGCGGGMGDSADRQVVEVDGVTGGIGGFGNAFSRIETWAMREALLYVRDNYNNIPVFITENGVENDETTGLNDHTRAAYFSAYLRTMAKTINEDNANVLGMSAWTLVDDFEWGRAYGSKMGLVHVDYTSPKRTRTLKISSEFFIKTMEDGIVPLVELPGSAAHTSTHLLCLILPGVFLIKLLF